MEFLSGFLAVSQLEPLFSPIKEPHSYCDYSNHTPDHKIAVLPLQLGQECEIHAIHSNDESQREKDAADDRQSLHDLIHTVGFHVHLQLQQAIGGFAEDIQRVDFSGNMVINIGEIHIGVFLGIRNVLLDDRGENGSFLGKDAAKMVG